MDSSRSKPNRPLRIGTRGSKLARWQADWVAAELSRQGHPVEIVEISTHGDRQQAGPLSALGGEGVFTKEIQRALLASEVDLAVHSLKDLPTKPVAGLVLGAVPPRASTADALVSNTVAYLDQLPPGASVGTGSPRRQAQLLYRRPDLRVQGIRGNIDTRLRKLDDGEYDAIILAEAGLQRLGFSDRISQSLTTDIMLPAVGQGALGIECRSDDAETQAALLQLNHQATQAAVEAERALLACIEAGCSAPVGALALPADTLPADSGQLHLRAAVFSTDGQTRLYEEATGDASHARVLGERMAEKLLEKGAAALIAKK